MAITLTEVNGIAAAIVSLKQTKRTFSMEEYERIQKLIYDHSNYKGFIVTGKPHDGGIDGIISEDKLGLDLIYIQAKRFANGNKVTRHDLQAFIGAMEHINKGVFITTSSFTRSAIQFIEKQQQKNIKLIDGNLLADLLVKYEVGVAAAQTFKLYKLDTEYFNF